MDPSSFPEDAAGRAAAAAAAKAGKKRAASDSCLDAALRGAIFEEVPTRLVHIKAAHWALQAAHALAAAGLGGTGGSDGSAVQLTAHTEYITLTLEFGDGQGLKPPDAGVPPANPLSRAGRQTYAQPTFASPRLSSKWGAVESGEDPYGIWRVKSTPEEPQRSSFIHPVLRYHHSSAFGEPPVGTVAQPSLTLHLMEDFRGVFDDFSRHTLSLARWLQDVAARRVELAAGAVLAGDAEARAALIARSLAPHPSMASYRSSRSGALSGRTRFACAEPS